MNAATYIDQCVYVYIWGECTYRDPVHFIKAHYITFNSWKGMRVIEEGGRKGGGKRRGGNRQRRKEIWKEKKEEKEGGERELWIGKEGKRGKIVTIINER